MDNFFLSADFMAMLQYEFSVKSGAPIVIFIFLVSHNVRSVF